MSMGAPACDVIPRTEGLLEGEGGSRGKGGREIHPYRALALVDACHWSRQHSAGASQPITCSKQPKGLDRLCGWSLRARC